MGKSNLVKAKGALRSEYLSFVEVLAQSIASIAPTASLVLVIPLVFGTAGNGTWLAYLFALVAIALVAINLNQFTSKSASAGSLYGYIVKGLGPEVGFISGWALIIAYTLTASAVLSGFVNYANVLLGYIGINAPGIILAIIGSVTAWYIAFKDIKLSAKLMLIFEGLSVVTISILGIIVLIKHGIKLDYNQFTLKDVSPTSIRIGLVLSFFSFVGFESAASLGDEAKKPLKTIPKAIIISAIGVGIFFIIFSYTEVLGFIGSSVKLNEATAPLVNLANYNSVGFFGPIISVGALFSFWSSFLACTNAGSRILYSMGEFGIVTKHVGNVHKDNKTPYVSITVVSILAAIIPIILIAFKSGLFDIYGWVGTIATYGLLLEYALVTIAAPVYLYKLKQLKIKNIILSVVTFLILLIPIVGSVYPLPAAPYGYFPFVFLGWLSIGGIWFGIKKFKNPNLSSNIVEAVEKINKKQEDAEVSNF